jgi:hypothetical protein
MKRLFSIPHVRFVGPALLALLFAACSGGGKKEVGAETVEAGGDTFVKSYMVAGEDIEAHSIATQAEGGSFQLTTLKDAAHSSQSLALVSLDAVGDVRWARRWGRDATSGLLKRITAASEAPDGSVWVAGQSVEGGTVVKLAADGQVLTRLQYGSADAPVVVRAIAATVDGGFVAAGMTIAANSEARRLVDPSSSELTAGDLWLLRADAAGVTRWLRINDVTNEENVEVVLGLELDAAEEITVFGRQITYFLGRQNRFWAARFRFDGRLAFSQRHTGFATEGNGRSALTLSRSSSSNADYPALIVVGSNYGNQPLGGGTLYDPQFVYMTLPAGDVVQNEELDLGAETDSYEQELIAVSAMSDDNNVVVAGNRYVCEITQSGDCASDRFIRQGIVQVMTRTPTPTPPLRFHRGEQRSPVHFGRAADTRFLAMTRTGNEYLVLSGSKREGVYLSRLNAALQADFSRSIPWEGPDKFPFAMASTRDGGALVWGGVTLRRLQASGAIAWTYGVGPVGGFSGEPVAVVALPDGGAVFAANGSFEGRHGAAIVRYHADGSLRFARLLEDVHLQGLVTLDDDGDGQSEGGVLGVGLRISTETTIAARLTPSGSVRDVVQLPEHRVLGSIGRADGRILVGLDSGVWWLNAAGVSEAIWHQNEGAESTVAAITPDGGAWLVVTYDGTGRFGSATATRFSRTGADLFARDLVTVDAEGELAEFHPIGATSRPDGGLVVVGYDTFFRDTNLDRCFVGNNCQDAIMASLGPNGEPGFLRTYGGGSADKLGGISLSAGTADNGVMTVGDSQSFFFPRQSILAIRGDADGKVSSACQAQLSATTQLVVNDARRARVIVGVPTTLADLSPINIVDLALASDSVAIVTARACSGVSEAPAVVVDIVGAGTVASSIPGIACPGDCEQSYSTGTQFDLLASPAQGSRFVGWSGACATTQTQNAQLTTAVTLQASQRCTATFASGSASAFEVAVAISSPIGAYGNRVTSTPAGIDCMVVTGGTLYGACRAQFSAGTTVRLHSMQSAGSTFSQWTGCDRIESATTPVCAVEDTGVNRVITAAFQQATGALPPTASFTVEGETIGPPSIEHHAARFDGRASTDDIRVVRYEWDWENDGVFDCAQVEGESTCGSPLLGVALHQYTIEGSVTAALRVTDGLGLSDTERVTFEVIGATYRLDLSLVYPIGTSGHHVYSAPVALDCEVTAGGQLSGTCSAEFGSSQYIELEAVAGSGTRFDRWTGCAVEVVVGSGLPPRCGVFGVSGVRAVSAAFVSVPAGFSVNVSMLGTIGNNLVLSMPGGMECVSSPGGGSPSGSCSMPYTAAQVRLRATAASGSSFVSWSGCDSLETVTPGAPPLCVINNTGGARNVSATFAP